MNVSEEETGGRGLQGFVFKAGVVLKSMTRKEEGFPGYTSGFIEAVWRELQAIHRFSTEYFRPEDGTWGVILPNGSWNGMIREILSGRINVGVSDFLITSERVRVVDFLPPLINTGTYVFIKKNFETDLYWDSFVSPFVSDLWGALAATALLIVGCLLLDWALLRGYTRQLPLKESLYFVLACFLMQGQTPHSRLGSMCTIYVTAYSIASVMFSAYSAALVSILAVQTDVLPFTTFQGLLDDGTYKLGVLEGSAQISYLDRTEDSTLRKVYEKLIAPQLSNMPSNVSVGLQRVCHNNKKYAFMVELANVWGLVRNLPCHVVRVPGTEIPSVISIVLPKNFTYQHLLRQTVLQMRSAGILQRLHRMNIPAEKEMNDVHEVHLSLNSFLILLTLLGAGIVVSCIFLLVEILSYKLATLCARRRTFKLERKSRRFDLTRKIVTSRRVCAGQSRGLYSKL